MIETTGVVHFTIPVSDIDRSETFYHDILGLETISRASEPFNLLFMKVGQGHRRPGKVKNANPGDERFVHHAFGVPLDK